jgi:hypothetical protein
VVRSKDQSDDGNRLFFSSAGTAKTIILESDSDVLSPLVRCFLLILRPIKSI